MPLLNDRILYYQFLILILFPTPAFFSDQVQQYTLFSVIIFSSFFGWYQSSKFLTNRVINILFAFILLSILTSIIVNLISISNHFDIILELIRYISYYIIFSSLYSLFAYSPCRVNMYRKIIVVALVSQIIIIFLSYTPVEYIVDLIYNTEKQNTGLGIYQKIRLVGSFENPNYLALFMVMIFSAVTLPEKIFSFKEKLYLSALIFIVVFLTGSRTGMIILLLQMIFYFKNFSIIILPFLFWTILDFVEKFDRFRDLLSYDTLIEIPALQERFGVWSKVWGDIMTSPFLGSASLSSGVVDNYYLLLLSRYGFIFLIVLLVSFFLFNYLLSKSVKAFHHYNAFLYLIPVALFLLFGSFLENFRLFFIFLFFYFFILFGVSKGECGAFK
jgi:hypothetical protein